MQHCDSVSMTQVTEGRSCPRTDTVEFQNFPFLITVARFSEADKICDFVELTAEPQLLPFAPKRDLQSNPAGLRHAYILTLKYLWFINYSQVNI